MNQLTQMLGAAVADLQAFKAVSGKYVGLPERIAQTKAELAATTEELRKAKAELKATTAKLARTKDENAQRYRSDIDASDAQLRELDVSIGKARVEFDKLAQATREAQARHNNILDEINTLKSKLGV